MDAVKLLAQDGDPSRAGSVPGGIPAGPPGSPDAPRRAPGAVLSARLGALAVLGRLCEQDPTFAEGTAHIVHTARCQWTVEGSSTPALEEAALRLLARIEAPQMPAGPTGPRSSGSARG